MPQLTEQQVADYHENGYLVIPNFFNTEVVNDLRGSMSKVS